MIAFLYARVSTGEQDTGMQIRELLEYAKRRDWQTEVFTDSISGAKDRRPGLDQMMAQVRRRKCDVVLVYRYDRFARSLQQLVNALEEFRVLGVNFVSLHEGVDTSTPNGRLVFGIFASIAEFERELIRDRVRSGMRHAKAQGVHIGRPRLMLDAFEIASLRAQGLTWPAISERVGAGVSSCQKAVRNATQKGCKSNETSVADSKGLGKAVEN